MAEILKFVYGIVLFFFSFIFAIEATFMIAGHIYNCMPFYHLFQISLFAFWSVDNLLSCFSNIIFLSFFITVPTVCETDADCPTSEDLYFDIKCIDHMCVWIGKVF
jgi:hypothetical protein